MTNDAAERMRDQMALDYDAVSRPVFLQMFNDALAAERRATAERITQGVRLLPHWDKRSVPGGLHVKRADVLAILDAEADR